MGQTHGTTHTFTPSTWTSRNTESSIFKLTNQTPSKEITTEQKKKKKKTVSETQGQENKRCKTEKWENTDAKTWEGKHSGKSRKDWRGHPVRTLSQLIRPLLALPTASLWAGFTEHSVIFPRKIPLQEASTHISEFQLVGVVAPA